MKRNPLIKVSWLALLWVSTSLALAAQERRVINSANFKPHDRPYSSSILAGDTLYVSGQGSRDADGKLPQTFEAQMRQCLQNVRDILQGGGMDFENAVWMNVYLADLSNYEVMNRVYWETIGNSPPARTVLGVADLPAGNRVEINCVAVRDARSKRAIGLPGRGQGPGADPPAILTGDMLYLSAQDGWDPKSGKYPEDLSAQVKQALENVGEVLNSAGMTHKNVVWVNPYMDNFKRYEEMNRVYASFFEFGNTPGRGTIEVAQLPDQNHIVLSCIAGADLAKRKAVKPRNMAPSPTASPGILYGDTLYLSAKSGFIPGQGIVTPDLDLQLRQTMRNLLDGLEEADMDLSDVVSSTVYLKNMNDYDRMNNLYRTFFKEAFPARTTLQSSFDKETKTEEQISVIAVRKSKP